MEVAAPGAALPSRQPASPPAQPGAPVRPLTLLKSGAAFWREVAILVAAWRTRWAEGMRAQAQGLEKPAIRLAQAAGQRVPCAVWPSRRGSCAASAGVRGAPPGTRAGSL